MVIHLNKSNNTFMLLGFSRYFGIRQDITCACSKALGESHKTHILANMPGMRNVDEGDVSLEISN
jgi:hypothetical protein